MKTLIIVNEIDNVGLSKEKLNPNEVIETFKSTIEALSTINIGERMAIEDIPSGKEVIQYSHPFAISKGIKKGEAITQMNTEEISADINSNLYGYKVAEEIKKAQGNMKFWGYKRSYGKVGTRNYYLVMPLSECASETALQIANNVLGKTDLLKKYQNIDDVISIPNTEGCGCAANIQIDRFLTVLNNYICHPNVGKVLAVDLGCEQTNIKRLRKLLEASGTSLENIDFISIQEEGGTENTIKKGTEIIIKNLKSLNKCTREKCDFSNIIMGTECGASDAFSGISANYIIGKVVDDIILQGGSAILSEIPEMVGTEHILLKRMKNVEVAEKFIEMMNWYKDLASRLGKDLKDNLVPENIAGGLINNCIKSLGAIVKGGSSMIVDALEYGERVKEQGLNLMQGPGNDLESVTGISAGGANLILFSTGRGTVTGSAITPVIKISSTTEMFDRMKHNMDFNAGALISQDRHKYEETIKSELFEMIIKVASGEKTKAEINNQKQFQVWTAGKVSL